jgi:hypothetical protein
MERAIRCTVCTWRGPWDVAESAPRIRARQSDPVTEEVQQAYADHEAESVRLGAAPPPPCPQCGHHTVVAKLHSYRAAM